MTSTETKNAAGVFLLPILGYGYKQVIKKTYSGFLRVPGTSSILHK
jgi:hypothetical protein